MRGGENVGGLDKGATRDDGGVGNRCPKQVTKLSQLHWHDTKTLPPFLEHREAS